MNPIYAEYDYIFKRFISGALNAREFQVDFLRQFKSETRSMDEALYSLLEDIFGE
ncbi:colicin immunity domain-containing protein [Ottowia sp.]|uniref:colicin immunity domain-containing protein n=1 Tax=Ottowia sp. TaxID=1898956 RepID=UPI0039E23E2C